MFFSIVRSQSSVCVMAFKAELVGEHPKANMDGEMVVDIMPRQMYMYNSYWVGKKVPAGFERLVNSIKNVKFEKRQV